jgi:GxxExxY protein
MDLLHKNITDKISKFFYKVYNELGFGFLKKVYQNALYLELVGQGFFVKNRNRLKIFTMAKPWMNITLVI